MVLGIVNNFKCSSFFYFLHLRVPSFSLCPSIYARSPFHCIDVPLAVCASKVSLLFCLPVPVHLWRCFQKNVYESISLRHYKTVHDHPFIVQMFLSPSARPQFLFCFASLCSSICGAAYKKMFTSRSLCAIIRRKYFGNLQSLF